MWQTKSQSSGKSMQTHHHNFDMFLGGIPTIQKWLLHFKLLGCGFQHQTSRSLPSRPWLSCRVPSLWREPLVWRQPVGEDTACGGFDGSVRRNANVQICPASGKSSTLNFVVSWIFTTNNDTVWFWLLVIIYHTCGAEWCWTKIKGPDYLDGQA